MFNFETKNNNYNNAKKKKKKKVNIISCISGELTVRCESEKKSSFILQIKNIALYKAIGSSLDPL